MAILNGFEAEEQRVRALIRETRKEMTRAAHKLADKQEQFIEAEKTPGGRAQKANNPRYRKRKKDKPPLEKTGLLKKASAWRVSGERNYVVLRPPVGRDAAVGVLEKRGYKLITTTLPKNLKNEIQKDLDGIVDDIMIYRRRR